MSDWQLWFAFILVSLIHWKQHYDCINPDHYVVICFHFSIFDPLETARVENLRWCDQLWFAFILVSLIHWKQPVFIWFNLDIVVICFHFSIFDPLETAAWTCQWTSKALWFAFILVSLIHWKQPTTNGIGTIDSCDLLSF